MFGTRVEVDEVAKQRAERIAALRGALDLLGDANVVIAADLDVLFHARPGPVALENGSWDFEAEQQLGADLRSVMNRLAGVVYRLEREQAAERRGGAMITPHAA